MISKHEVLEKNKALLNRILYMLCPCEEGKRLGEALLLRYADYVYALPASEKHHHSEEGGLLAHSLDVALKALAEFEAGYLGERRADGSLDHFASHRHRPQWRYAIFVAALLHDAGKVFNAAAEQGGEQWNPLVESLSAFIDQHPKANVTWRRDPAVSEKHAALNPLLAARLLTPEDIAYLETRRFVQAMEALASDREMSGNEVSRFIKRADRSSAREGLATVKEHADDKVAHFLRALKALIRSGELKVNCPQAQVYVQGEQAAVVVPSSINLARMFLRGEKVLLPENLTLYNLLRDRGAALANEKGRVVKKIRAQAGEWKTDYLTAIVFPAATLFSEEERSGLRRDVRFEALVESEPRKDGEKEKDDLEKEPPRGPEDAAPVQF